MDHPNNIIVVSGAPKIVARAAHENSVFVQPLISVSQTEGQPRAPLGISENEQRPTRSTRRRRRRRVRPRRATGSSFEAIGVLQKDSGESRISRDGQKYYELRNVARARAAAPPEKKIEMNL